MKIKEITEPKYGEQRLSDQEARERIIDRAQYHVEDGRLEHGDLVKFVNTTFQYWKAKPTIYKHYNDVEWAISAVLPKFAPKIDHGEVGGDDNHETPPAVDFRQDAMGRTLKHQRYYNDIASPVTDRMPIGQFAKDFVSAVSKDPITAAKSAWRLGRSVKPS